MEKRDENREMLKNVERMMKKGQKKLPVQLYLQRFEWLECKLKKFLEND